MQFQRADLTSYTELSQNQLGWVLGTCQYQLQQAFQSVQITDQDKISRRTYMCISLLPTNTKWLLEKSKIPDLSTHQLTILKTIEH